MLFRSPFIVRDTTVADDGVVGLTKTGTYNYNAQYMQVANYWNDVNDRWMTWAYASAVSMTDSFEANHFQSSDYYPSADANNPQINHDYYADINDGLLVFEATDAGKYIVRFTLTSNAVWSDGSKLPVDVTFVISKLQYDTPFIDDGKITADINKDGTVSPDGFTDTYTFELDTDLESGIERTMRIYNHNTSILRADPDGIVTSTTKPDGSITVGTGTNTDIGPDGNPYGDYYEIKMRDAGTYTVTFTLDDFDNYRWKVADVRSITFILKINKKRLNNPVIANDYKTENETISGNRLSVQYDTREHTVMLRNMVGGAIDHGAGTLAGHNEYVKFEDVTDYTTPGAVNDTLTLGRYTDTASAGVIAKDIFGDKYVGNLSYNKDSLINEKDIFTFRTVKPGIYKIKVDLVNSDNMEWTDGSTDSQEFILDISKLNHPAPAVSSKTGASQEYRGGYTEFAINNVYNGVAVENGPVVDFQYENYEIIDCPAHANLTDVRANAQKSWYNGELTLRFVEVGLYTVRFWINPKVAEFVEWGTGTYSINPDAGSPDHINTLPVGAYYADIKLTVAQRSLTAEFSFTAPDNEETNANLQMGKAEWAISDRVHATLKISGFRNRAQDTFPSVDRDLDIKVYYRRTGTTDDTELVTINLANYSSYYQDPVDSEVYYILYELPDFAHGQGNVNIGAYNVIIEQNTPADGRSNYTLAPTVQKYSVVPDPAPFKKSLLRWRYATASNPTNYVYMEDGRGLEAGNRFTLPFIEGDTYVFSVTLTTEGWLGWDNAGTYTTFDDALASWWVVQSGLLGGNTSANTAGKFEYHITIAALDNTKYAYETQAISFYYEIEPEKYNLSGIRWDYNEANPFTFDGNSHEVKLVGTLPTGLSVASYTTTVSYTSGGVAHNGVAAGTSLSANKQVYAGTYITTVKFAVTGGDFKLPEQGKTDTYNGTFEWSVEWRIEKQEIKVQWAEGGTESDGVTIKYTPKVDGPHANKIDYKYRKWITENGAYEVDANGNPVYTSSITREPGKTARYEVTAFLKSSSSAGSDYDRSYKLTFIGEDNPMDYELGQNDKLIFNHIEVNDKTDTQYVWTGKPVDVKVIVDFDTTGGLIESGAVQVITNIYSTVNTSLPIPAPSEIGDYIIKLSLKYNSSGAADYALSEYEYRFSIVKASFDEAEFEWHYSIDTDDGHIEAVYNSTQNKWFNIETGEEVTIVYNGKGHKVWLVAKKYEDAGVLSINTSDSVKIEAGEVTSTAYFTYDSARWNAPTVERTFTWTVQKAFLDLSLVKWDYDKDYVYTIVGGKAKEYWVELENLPDYLLDKIKYETSYNGDFLDENKGSKAGAYSTIATIGEIDSDNYMLGDWPAGVPTKLDWRIGRKQITVPYSNGSWIRFDGTVHNLTNIFGFDVDWEEYFTVDIEYKADPTAVGEAYSGLQKFGNKYFAENAGIYTLKLSLKKELNDTEN